MFQVVHWQNFIWFGILGLFFSFPLVCFTALLVETWWWDSLYDELARFWIYKQEFWKVKKMSSWSSPRLNSPVLILDSLLLSSLLESFFILFCQKGVTWHQIKIVSISETDRAARFIQIFIDIIFCCFFLIFFSLYLNIHFDFLFVSFYFFFLCCEFLTSGLVYSNLGSKMTSFVVVILSRWIRLGNKLILSLFHWQTFHSTFSDVFVCESVWKSISFQLKKKNWLMICFKVFHSIKLPKSLKFLFKFCRWTDFYERHCQ